MNIYDISMTIKADMAVYKNKDNKRPKLVPEARMPEASYNESSIIMNLHTGTHVDAPFHMSMEGATMETMDLSQLIGKCRVIDLTGVKGYIGEADLADKEIQAGEFVLLKTVNSLVEEFVPEYVYVAEDAARYLARKGIRGVGSDALGIERAQAGHETHKVLMEAGVVILEGLRLKDVPEYEYTLIALPLKIEGADGSPVRAVLLKGEMK